MKLHEKLRLTRRHLGLTQAQMAKKMNVSSRSITNYESGVRIPGADYIANYSKVTGVAPDYFLSDITHLPALGPNPVDSFVSNQPLAPDEGRAKAEQLLSEVNMLFAGGELDSHDRDSFFRAVSDIYFESRARSDRSAAPTREKPPADPRPSKK
ncbi:MAG: helix-turn-helix domain-containing protein [Fastidiosipilaceae bacterium]|jgi:transcriptional regulator with XRE-family HTH domain